MCLTEVKISSFNPAFVIPEEHLESLKEHFSQTLSSYVVGSFSLLQMLVKESLSSWSKPTDSTLSHTITSHSCRRKITFVHHRFACSTQRHG